MWIALWVTMVMTAALVIRHGGRRIVGFFMYWVTRWTPPMKTQMWIDGNKSIYIRDVKDGKVFLSTLFGRSQLAWSCTLSEWNKFIRTNKIWKSPKPYE